MLKKSYKIALISCVKRKSNKPCKAKDMYISQLFKNSYLFAKENAEKVYILSAKYGLLQEDDIISPYEQTLKDMNIQARKIWSYKVLKKLEKLCDIENDNFLILAGEKYREFICQKIKHYDAPLAKFGLGKQIQFLKNQNKCLKTH